MQIYALCLLPFVLHATEIPNDFKSVPAKWHQGLDSTVLVGYKKGEHLIVSDIWTGTPGRDAVIKHMLAVKISQWGKPFTDQYESTDKKQKETLTVTLYETDNAQEMKAEFEHTVYETGKVVLRFSGITILQRCN
ncbi:MAG: hypothetical protein PHD76_02830 [Methylacidiphilales bacterium]|nr:hypothetical protein [Candidatus Methylacidiphilales bacterium]